MRRISNPLQGNFGNSAQPLDEGRLDESSSPVIFRMRGAEWQWPGAVTVA